MVGPSVSEDERTLWSQLLKVGFTLLVGVSGAILAFHAGGGWEVIGASLAGGLLLGAVLTWFVARNLRAIQPEGMKERREMERRRRR